MFEFLVSYLVLYSTFKTYIQYTVGYEILKNLQSYMQNLKEEKLGFNWFKITGKIFQNKKQMLRKLQGY